MEAARGTTVGGTRATLHMLCGKAGAGKSTLAARLAEAPGTLLVAQDPWMATLYPEMRTVDDYLRHVGRLRAAMEPHLVELLRAGLSVVLDWPANTAAARAWMRGVADAGGAAHRLHWLDLSDDDCFDRVLARNEAGHHPYRMTRAQFDEITGYFEPPTDAEGFAVERYAVTAPRGAPPRTP